MNKLTRLSHNLKIWEAIYDAKFNNHVELSLLTSETLAVEINFIRPLLVVLRKMFNHLFIIFYFIEGIEAILYQLII